MSGYQAGNRLQGKTGPGRGYNPDEPRDARGRWTTGGATTSRQKNWLDRSLLAKAVAGEAARDLGLLPGALRGAWHTFEGLGDSVYFASRLTNPWDPVISPHGDAAWDKVVQAGKGVADYASNALLHPKTVANDVGASLHRFEVETDPLASPQADTLAGEAARNFNIGLKQGEFGFDVASLFYGGAEAKGLTELGTVSKGAGAASYLARGYPKTVADYFAEPYDGLGHHFLPQRMELPTWLGGGPVPDWISNSPFFLLKPPNMSKGDFFELHYQVDPYYHGGNISKKHGGGGWSGKRLGWKKHGPLGRLRHGSPAPLKAAVGAGVVGAGAAVDQARKGKGPRR